MIGSSEELEQEAAEIFRNAKAQLERAADILSELVRRRSVFTDGKSSIDPSRHIETSAVISEGEHLVHPEISASENPCPQGGEHQPINVGGNEYCGRCNALLAQ